MTSRERVLRALNRQAPDRTPADYKAEPEVNDRMTRSLEASSHDEILERLQVDVRRVEPAYVGPPSKHLADGSVEDYWGIRSRRIRTSHGSYSMYVETDLWTAESVEDLEAHDWPSCDIFDYGVMKAQCGKWPEHAIMYDGSDIFTRPCIMRGMENLLLDMAVRPEMAHYLIEKFTGFYREDLTRALEAAGDGFHIYCEWSDFGTQEGLLMSAEMWTEFVAPYLKRLIDVCHTGGVRSMLHSCGAVRDLVPSFIELGVDILDPIQVAAKGMEPAGLKVDFGDQLAFHGGIDTQSTLPFVCPDDVRREVRDRAATLGAGGGYVIAPSHNIQPDTPTENVLAMYEVEHR